MAYTTTFEGAFTLDRYLLDYQASYLLDFSRTRHCKRDPFFLESIPDPVRESVGLPLGSEAEYFANYRWAREYEDEAVIDYNCSPLSQPGLWCQWIPTVDARGIQWQGNCHFRNYLPWLQYIIQHFLQPWGYHLSGCVFWQGESPGDVGEIIVRHNRIIMPEQRDYLAEAIAPAQLPPQVYKGLVAVQSKDPTLLWSWMAVMREAEVEGFPETATWIQENLREYVRIIERGFVNAGGLYSNPR